jgi:putative ABC transport system permease protein
MNLLKKLRALFRKEKFEAEMAEEMRLHLEERTRANIAAGMSSEEARYAAQRSFGGMDQLKEVAREQRGLRWLEGAIRDVRYATRQLVKAPGFTVTIVLILGLGIGGVTAMFSSLYAVMIRPLPYPQAERLVMGVATFNGVINPLVSGPDYLDYRDQNQSFTALGAFTARTSEESVSRGQTTERVDSLIVSADFFQALDVKMVRGRAFTPDDAKANATPTVVISHAYWRQHYDAIDDLSGITLTINGTAHALIGVTPADFHFVSEPKIWRLAMPRNIGPRRYNNWLLLGRLKEGVSMASAQSDVDVIASQLEKTYPDTNTGKALLLRPLQNAVTKPYESGFAMLCGGAGAVLLIACANAAGLLLARGAGRQSEMAVRAALGASHGQIMRLLLAEALLLAGAAGVLGTLLAVWIESALMRLFSVETLFLRDTGLSWPVLVFVLTVTVITGVGFGLLPAWRARRPDLMLALKAGGKGSARQGTRLRGSLVAAQVSVSFILLVVAGLLMRSLSSLHETHPGFDPHNLLTVELPLPHREYKDPQRTQFFESLLENVRALPGVRSAAAISQLPLRDPYNDIGLYDASNPPANPRDSGNGFQRVVLPGYFETMGIPLLAGRDVRSSDTREAARVVVISQVLAEELFPGRDPLGRQVIVDGDTRTPWEVVGVVGDIKSDGLRDEPRSRGAFYRSHAQMPYPTMRLAIRTSGDPSALVAPLRALVEKMDSRAPLSGPRTMEEVMNHSTIGDKGLTLCLATFSLLAVTLAAVGIYGVLAYSVTQQRRDIGIKMALGANYREIAWGVLRHAGLLALAGVVIGALGALGISQLLRALLYGTAPQDPAVFVTSAVVLVLIAAIAAWFPARRATQVNPVETLRAE